MDRKITEYNIKLSGSCNCPLPLDDKRRYTIAMEVGIKNIVLEPDEKGGFSETYKVEPIGSAIIENAEGKRAPIKVKGSRSQALRFALQELHERLKLEDRINFDLWYEQRMNILIKAVNDEKEKA